jgi:hypothetical protein
MNPDQQPWYHLKGKQFSQLRNGKNITGTISADGIGTLLGPVPEMSPFFQVEMLLHICRGGGRSAVRLTSSSMTSRSASTLPEDEKKTKGGLYESLFGLSSNIAKPNTNR